MHECTSWRALGCMNFGTDPRSIGLDFAAGAFAPPLGFTAGGGGGGHQGFGRTGGLGVVLEECVLLALPMGGVGTLALEALTTWRVVRVQAAACLSVSPPFESAWKANRKMLIPRMHEKKGSCMQTPTFSSLALWGSALFRGYWTHDPGGMHARMGNGCMCYACVWSWLGARAARDDSTWLMSSSCTRQEQKIVKTSCVNDMRVWMRMHGFGFIKKYIHQPASSSRRSVLSETCQ